MRKNLFLRKLANPMVASVLLLLACNKSDIDEKSLNHTKKYSAQVANDWFTLLTNISRTKPYNPPQTLRIMAYAGLGLYESVVPGMPSYQSMLQQLNNQSIVVDKNKVYHWPACANAALARIATRILQQYPNANLTEIQALEASWEAKFALEITTEQLSISKSFGQYVGDLVGDYSKADGTLNTDGSLAVCPPYQPLGLPGKWEPTPPGFFPGAGACQGNLRTFIPNAVATYFPPMPPTYSTDPNSDFYKMVKETYDLRNGISKADSMIVEAWRDRLGMNYNTPSHVIRLSALILAKEQKSLEDAAVLFAKIGMSMSDAVGAAVGAKFNPSLAILRPITYIHKVMADVKWTSIYPTMQHPAWPAVATAAGAAGVQTLENMFGTRYAFTDSIQQSIYGVFQYDSFDQMLQDVGKSRTHGGFNYRPAVAAGAGQGRAIANRVHQLAFRKP